MEEDQVDQEDQQYEPPPLTVFDRRGGVRSAPNPTPAETTTSVGDRALAEPRESADQNRQVAPSVRELVSVIIVFKDGHEQEIGNYAIVGDTLYELGNSIAHKIKLADLDLKQTVDKNEQRGVEFSLPANLKPQV